MEQRLCFHEKWEKALAPRDKSHITELFLHLEHQKGLTFPGIRVAQNHKGELLASVLIENCMDREWSTPINLLYSEAGMVLAEHQFTNNVLTVSPYTSMPWTFIFPKSSLVWEPQYHDWNVDKKETGLYDDTNE